MGTELGLYRPSRSDRWYYDFQVNGDRYSRSTRKTTYREAVRVARDAYAQVVNRSTTPTRKDRLTLEIAFGRYFEEKGQALADADDILLRLDRLAEWLGRNRFLDELTLADLHNYQERRKKDGVANRTVNSDVPETIRRVMRQARKWHVETPEIDWSELNLDLPRHRVRSLTRKEKARLLWAVRKDHRRLVYFAMRSGLRLSALILRKDQILWDLNLIQYKAKSKYENDTKFLPMPPRVRRLIAHCCKQAPDSDWVFTYVMQRRRGPRPAGSRAPVTGRGFERVMRDAVDIAKLPDWRLIHDLRHTAATDTMQASQHPGAVKEMLGHSTIEQTMKYAHVLQEDVLRAMSKVR